MYQFSSQDDALIEFITINRNNTNFGKMLIKSGFDKRIESIGQCLDMTDRLQTCWHIINRSCDIPTCVECKSRPAVWSQAIYYKTKKQTGYLYCSRQCKSLAASKNIDYSYINGSELKEKKRQTTLKRYGVDHVTQVQQFKEKRKKTFLEKYGVDNYSKTEEHAIKGRVNAKKNFAVNYKRNGCELIGYPEKGMIEIKVMKCNHVVIIPKARYKARIDWGISPCSICEPLYGRQKSQAEQRLLEFIKLKFPDAISTRKVIPPYELDIYIPSLKLAFEYNGVYWHSKRSNHNKKSKLCNDIGIKLIHLWERNYLISRRKHDDTKLFSDVEKHLSQHACPIASEY